MAAIEGVERCFCVFDKDKERLKGFYVGEIEKNALHTIMLQTMPGYMVPGFIRKLSEIPMTKNGKIDRRKINEMTGGRKSEPKLSRCDK